METLFFRSVPACLGPLFLQSGFSDAVLHYMRGFCRDFVVNVAVDFSVGFLSFASRDGRRTRFFFAIIGIDFARFSAGI